MTDERPKAQGLSHSDIVEAIEGLLEIAETAMPNSFYATDSRVKRARAVLTKLSDLSGSLET